MELTEKERLTLVKKKEEICGLTLEILDIAYEPRNFLEIKKRMTMILSLLNTIASYADSKNYRMDGFMEMANRIFATFNEPPEYLERVKKENPVLWKNHYVYSTELFCNYANSVRFDFTKSGIKIHFPKIDISLFRAK